VINQRRGIHPPSDDTPGDPFPDEASSHVNVRTERRPTTVSGFQEKAIPPLRPLLPGGAVLRLSVTVEELRTLPLDARAAYVLSLVDGRCSVDLILDICEMDRGDALAALADLLELGAIEVLGPTP
jgi:hypothetical protein